MKRAFCLLMIVAFVVSWTAPSFAALPEPVDRTVQKVGKGMWDILTFPYDIAKGTYEETKASTFKPFGLLGGFLKSSADGVKKVVTAAVDIGLSPIELIR